MCQNSRFYGNISLMSKHLKYRWPILCVTSSETCSVCVKQALNTRRWLVKALVTWHVSYKVTTLFFIRIFFVKQKDEAAPCKVDDHHLSSSNRGKKTGIQLFFYKSMYFGHTILTMWKAPIIRLKLLYMLVFLKLSCYSCN